MKNKYCYFFIFLCFFLLAYISIDTYFDISQKQKTSIDTQSFFIKIFFLAFIFIFVAVVLTYYKIRKKNNLKKELETKSDMLIIDNSSLKDNSNLDPLTQCLNKEYFLSKFDDLIKKAIKDKQVLSFFIVNIDEFKSFNDIYGENEGDECLKLIANIIVKYCNGKNDLVSRFGKDEFYILLPNNPNVNDIAIKCLESVRRLKIPHENSIASNILTISIGISSLLPLHQDQKDELISKAKNSLLEAKKNGRNRIC